MKNLSLEANKILRLIHDEFHTYDEGYQLRIDINRQQNRAILIEWFAVFLPEVFTPSLIEEIQQFLRDSRKDEDFSYYGWYMNLPIEIAVSVLTESVVWNDNAILNMSHENKTLRDYVARILSLGVPAINSFDEEELFNNILVNYNKSHLDASNYTLLLFASTIDVDKKLEWLQYLLECLPDINSWEQKLLIDISKGKYISNTFYLPFYLEIQQYIILRLLSKDENLEETNTTSLHNEIEQQSEIILRGSDNKDELDFIFSRIKSHPFMNKNFHFPELSLKGK